MPNKPDTRIFFCDDELRYAQFADMDMRDYSFNQTIVTHGEFERANLTGTKFIVRAYRAEFGGANFTGVNASGSSFFGCDFRGANFWKADLSRVRFGNSNVTNAQFLDADLFDADLQSAIGLMPKDLITARNWRHARLPAHVRHDAEILEMLHLRRDLGVGNTRATSPAEPDVEIDLTGVEPTVTVGDVPDSARLELAIESHDVTRPVSPPRPRLATRAARLYQDTASRPRTAPDAPAEHPEFVLDRNLAL